jgi:hypothetical protein
MTVAEMAIHVEELCRQHALTVEYRDRVGGYAIKRRRKIVIRPIKSERTYVIALHEIGHIVGPGRAGRRLDTEAAAWEFVLAIARAPLSLASHAFMLKALESYLHKAHRTGRMVLPVPDAPFWNTYARLRALAQSQEEVGLVTLSQQPTGTPHRGRSSGGR